MNIQTKDVLGVAAVVVVGYLIFKLYQDNKKTAGFAGGLGGKRWRVGRYNPSTNQTAVVNVDNPSEVKYVTGRINTAKDTIFSGR